MKYYNVKYVHYIIQANVSNNSACGWWKTVKCGTRYIDLPEAVVYVIPQDCSATSPYTSIIWYHMHHSFIRINLSQISTQLPGTNLSHTVWLKTKQIFTVYDIVYHFEKGVRNSC